MFHFALVDDGHGLEAAVRVLADAARTRGRFEFRWRGVVEQQGMTVPMEKLDSLVAGHLEDRLLDPARLEEVLATVLDRRQERTERRHEAYRRAEQARDRDRSTPQAPAASGAGTAAGGVPTFIPRVAVE